MNAIVTRFERPANPQAEIAGALRGYGATPEHLFAPAVASQGIPAAPSGLSAGLPSAIQLALRILAG